MELDLALERLLDTGWSALDTTGHDRTPSGHLFPTPQRVADEFQDHGWTLHIRKIDLFDCYRAEWTPTGQPHPAGAVVGKTEEAAAVHALASWREAHTTAPTA